MLASMRIELVSGQWVTNSIFIGFIDFWIIKFILSESKVIRSINVFLELWLVNHAGTTTTTIKWSTIKTNQQSRQISKYNFPFFLQYQFFIDLLRLLLLYLTWYIVGWLGRWAYLNIMNCLLRLCARHSFVLLFVLLSMSDKVTNS